MADRRKKDLDWCCADEDGSSTAPMATLAVLMDIRDELKRMNTIICCDNFIAVPRILRSIRNNTAKPRRKPVAKKKRVTVRR